MSWFNGKQAAERNQASRSGARRRAREQAAAGAVRPPTLDEVYAAAGGPVYCSVCRLPVAREQASLEHAQPLAKGGAHDAVNASGVSHQRCNARKGSRLGPRRKGLKRGKPLRRKPRVIPEEAW